MEIKVTTQGISCHGSAPERGDNAIYKMAPILNELKALQQIKNLPSVKLAKADVALYDKEFPRK